MQVSIWFHFPHTHSGLHGRAIITHVHVADKVTLANGLLTYEWSEFRAYSSSSEWQKKNGMTKSALNKLHSASVWSVSAVKVRCSFWHDGGAGTAAEKSGRESQLIGQMCPISHDAVFLWLTLCLMKLPLCLSREKPGSAIPDNTSHAITNLRYEAHGRIGNDSWGSNAGPLLLPPCS